MKVFSLIVMGTVIIALLKSPSNNPNQWATSELDTELSHPLRRKHVLLALTYAAWFWVASWAM